MKLDEVATAAVKCGLIMPAGGNENLDHGDWHGSTEVYTSKPAFLKAVKSYFMEHTRAMTDEDEPEVIAQINAAKTMDDLADVKTWDEFTDSIWIDDRF